MRLPLERASRPWKLHHVLMVHLILAMLCFLPFIVKDGGELLMVADWNRQQIPFNTYANHAIKTGQVAWSHASDLGTNFVGAFSFYNLGSPFFWLSLLFPPEWFRYLIGPLFMLKFAAAGMSSFLYIRRYTKTDLAALLGSLLYAWSGFQITNLQFNHFHDVTAFFPLLLLSMDQLVLDKKRGRFALSVALMATLNYFFFIGQVIFIVITFLVRAIWDEEYRREKLLRSFLACVIEGLLGVGLACFILLPSILFVMGNPRTTRLIFSKPILEWFVSRDPRYYLMLLRAFLFPADPMTTQSVIYWTHFQSVAGYLPVVGVLPGLIYMVRKKDWLKKLLVIFLLMALLPVLNSSFLAFQSTYYTRWLFMPLLLAALASVRMLEAIEIPSEERTRRLLLRLSIVIGVIMAGFAILTFLIKFPEDEILATRPGPWLLHVMAALVMLLATYLVLRFQSSDHRARTLSILILPFVLVNTWGAVARMQEAYSYDRPQATKDLIYDAAPEIEAVLDDETSMERLYHSSVNWNLSFMMDRPTASSFLSTVSGSIWTFYNSLDISRFVFTKLPDEAEPLLDFLSVRYRIEESKLPDHELLFTHKTASGTIYVHRKPDHQYLPMGFLMKKWVHRDAFKRLTQAERMNALVSAVVLDKEEAAELEALGWSDRMLQVRSQSLEVSPESQRALVEQLGATAPKDLQRTRNGFTASYQLEKPALAYYTVPADEGWVAKVNGETVPVLEANGFMLVPLPEGHSQLSFEYQVPGFRHGVIVSLISGVLLLLWWGMDRLGRSRQAARKLS